MEVHFDPSDSVSQVFLCNPGYPSGFVPTTGESVSITTKPINIPPRTVCYLNNTNPIWYYYGQISHYQAGMVGIINPP